MYALFAVFATGSAFANEEVSVNSAVKQSFSKEFAGAQSVTWDAIASKDLFHASFVLNNERLNAYFNSEGVLIATGRFIAPENMPMLVSKGINARYSKYELTDVIEMISGNETSYIVMVQNEKAKVYVQAYSDGTTSVIKKERKK